MASNINATSRYRFTPRVIEELADGSRRVFLAMQDPVTPFVPDKDNAVHVVREGDTLENLAARFFNGYTDPAFLGWIIGQFQPTPILDPSRKLRNNSILIIPSPSLVNDLTGGFPEASFG